MTAISGDSIIWHDCRNGNGDINCYNLGTGETPITTDTDHQGYPAIYSDRIVWEDYQNGNRDISLYSPKEIPFPEFPSLAVPVISLMGIALFVSLGRKCRNRD